MVEVFKTNITETEAARQIALQIQAILPGAQINFDLDDCDKILRIENDLILIPEIQKIICASGFICEILI